MHRVLEGWMNWIERRLNDFSIRAKFYLIYILCMLIPLIMTDSVIIHLVVKSEDTTRYQEMQDMANVIQYGINNEIEQAAALGKSIYMSKYINDFLDHSYESTYDYVVSAQDFFQETLFENCVGVNNVIITMYADNESIVNGGNFGKISSVRSKGWYQAIHHSSQNKMLYFDYGSKNSKGSENKRRVYFIQKLNFYSKDIEKLLLVELDYSSLIRLLEKMDYEADAYICKDDKIVLSNGRHASVGSDFDVLEEKDNIGLTQEWEIYGANVSIHIMNTEIAVMEELRRNTSLILILILINVVFPMVMVSIFNRSFSKRLGVLTGAFKQVEGDHLMKVPEEEAKDEIGTMMRSYNIMAERMNSLVQTVYKNKIMEQEMMMARQKAELLALRSQINPHFLFNTLESIRMHSLIKREMETADMVEKLALLQRQYVDWGEDNVEVAKEMEFVEAYLRIQKYRFGDRLSYELDVEKECRQCVIPKLSLVTFVENACVHGIESKKTPGWIFVRVYRKDEFLYLEIEDTGKGMEEQEIAVLLEKMRNADIELLKGKERVGVINACLRLKMESQGEVQFEVDGEDGTGLMVQVAIPWKYVETMSKDWEKNNA